MNVLATSNIAAFEAEAKFLIFIVDANFILTHFGKIISTIFFKSCWIGEESVDQWTFSFELNLFSVYHVRNQLNFVDYLTTIPSRLVDREYLSFSLF